MPAVVGERMMHVLLIKHRATTTQLAEALDVPTERIFAALRDAEALGYIQDSGKPRLGWAITEDGVRYAQRRVDQTSADGKAVISTRYEVFRELNGELKKLCTDWQTRDPATNGAAEFSDRLGPIDDRIQRILAEIRPLADHFADYGARFARARTKFESGVEGYLTGVLVDSYHNIWFECHECFLITLGRSRSNEESGSPQ
ncbi:hypothetical protein [Amycolatopsis pithecellobii]|uniref:Uncharacterized protein n=1 Tax=Amycolatopsis pithecellobii TaxID=664692 RepID=A0A6N7Z5K6_9PSEU|nr:hypothetical protein [Amycolatopsis pithecellobii]MTD56939.1 hypothetical protein [Amycolatopsis pithecellobii]